MSSLIGVLQRKLLAGLATVEFRRDLSSYRNALWRGLLLALTLIVVNTAFSTLATFSGLSHAPLEFLGDLLFAEVGFLAILGGLVELSRSKGVHEFRRLAFGGEEQFSPEKYREASRSAIAFFSAALVLFLLLATLALLE